LLDNFIYDQLLQRRPHFLHELSQAVNFAFVKQALKDFYPTLFMKFLPEGTIT